MPLPEKLNEYHARIDKALEKWLPSVEVEPGYLHEAMRYAVLSGGKHIRPVLVYACGEAFGVEPKALDGPAAAVELIHAYSLIHDDLPAMDNDDLRRGKPTCHKAYNEATAILAGDAIQALAFHVIANDPNIKVTPEIKVKMIDTLAIASGSLGMAGGQAIDLASVGKQLTKEQLENMHNHKTGELIGASVKLGALSNMDITQQQFSLMSDFAKNIGLAFQVQDDILDVEGDTATLGKPQGSDIERNKPTYPNLLGLEGAKQAANDLHGRAIAALKSFDERADTLRQIADYVVKRNN